MNTKDLPSYKDDFGYQLLRALLAVVTITALVCGAIGYLLTPTPTTPCPFCDPCTHHVSEELTQ